MSNALVTGIITLGIAFLVTIVSMLGISLSQIGSLQAQLSDVAKSERVESISDNLAEIREDLGEVRASSQATSERVARIAAALPDMQINLAYEQVHRPIWGALMTSNPTLNDQGTWTSSITLFDAQNGWSTYLFEADGPDDSSTSDLAWALAGFGLEAGLVPVSVWYMNGIAIDIEEPEPVPADINPKSSLLFHEAGSQAFAKIYQELLSKAGSPIVSPYDGEPPPEYSEFLKVWGAFTVPPGK